MKITCPNVRARPFLVALLGLALSAGASVALAQDENEDNVPEESTSSEPEKPRRPHRPAHPPRPCRRRLLRKKS